MAIARDPLELVRMAAKVRDWNEQQRAAPPTADEIKRFFLARWPDICAEDVIHICVLAGPDQPCTGVVPVDVDL